MIVFFDTYIGIANDACMFTIYFKRYFNRIRA